MKSNYIAISPGATFSVLMIGGCLVDALYCLKAGDQLSLTLDLALSFAMARLVRADVRQPIRSGEYQRGWFAWEWKRDIERDDE